MTRIHHLKTQCPYCGSIIEAETPFSSWLRKNPRIRSSAGKEKICVVDQDMWVHQYLPHDGKEYACLMLVEIKTLGASLTGAQYDTYRIVNQVMRNRRQTPTKKLKHQAGICPILEVYSPLRKRNVQLRVFGAHVLTMSGLSPLDSEWIKWDKRLIDVVTLERLLRFELDPDTLRPLSEVLRSHHRRYKAQMLLPLTANIIPCSPDGIRNDACSTSNADLCVRRMRNEARHA